jgi:hypothetical protein
MSRELKTIHVRSDTPLAPLLVEAADAPLLLEKGGLFYRLEACASEDEWAGYDPQRVIAALDATAGTLSAAEADALIAELYRARKEGTRPADRP